MVKITFTTSSAQRIYNDYMKRVENNSTALSKDDKAELLMEFNSHIYEGTLNSTPENEVEVLLNVIGRLGSPEEILKPLVARKKLYQALHSFNPTHIFQAISLNLKNGLVYSVFGFLYIMLFSFVIIIAAKLITPQNTGLFYTGNSFRGFGFISETAGTTEVLGYWIVPLAAITALLFYLTITLLLRFIHK